LVEIVAGSVALNREQKRVANFVIRVQLVRASDAEKAVAAAAVASDAIPAASPASAPASSVGVKK
jgi:type IV pilus assembly protein PilN